MDKIKNYAKAKRIKINLSKKIINSIAAGVTIGLIVLIMESLRFDHTYGLGSSAIIYASIGASAFILFVMPKSRAAAKSAVTISYIIAGFVGYFSYYSSTYIGLAAAAALTVGLTGVFMVLSGKEHPPAVGLALAFVLFKVGLAGVLLVILLGFLIVGISYVLGIFIKDVEKEI
ncbi:MAG: HPP family protein [Candidatus Parvarchaeota archaeon]|nr:HPP family protein [Candidatus Parvarchaeota archaeon]